jgi:excisionase family DNA binding protein
MSIFSTGRSDGELGPLVVKPKIAWRMLNCSNTRGYELLAAGELDSFRDGRSRKITVESIHRYIARRLDPIESPNPKQKHHPRSRWRRRAPAAATTE